MDRTTTTPRDPNGGGTPQEDVSEHVSTVLAALQERQRTDEDYEPHEKLNAMNRAGREKLTRLLRETSAHLRGHAVRIAAECVGDWERWAELTGHHAPPHTLGVFADVWADIVREAEDEYQAVYALPEVEYDDLPF